MTAGVLLVAAYAAALWLVFRRTGNRATKEGFFVNSRASTPREVAFSIIVSCVGASATLGVMGKAFHVGAPAFWWLGAGAFGLAVLAVLLAGKVRAAGVYTLPEMVGSFLGQPARPLISLLIVAAWLAILAAQFSALSKVLGSLTGLPVQACLVLSFALIVLHSLGGQAVIMRLDRLQFGLIMGGLILALAWLDQANPGWTGRVRLEAVNAGFPASSLVYYFLVVGGNYLVCPMLFGRMLSARDTGGARRGGLLAAAGLAVCSLLIVAVGLACVGLIPESTPEDAVFTTVLDAVMPHWLKLAVLLALLGAVVSSADTCLVTAATVLSHDLLRRGNLRTCRACVLALGLAGLGVTLLKRSILGFLLMAYDVYVCGVVVPVFIGLLLNRRHRVLPGFACAAVLAGGAFGLAAAGSGETVFSYAGLGTAALLTLAGVRRRLPAAAVCPAGPAVP